MRLLFIMTAFFSISALASFDCKSTDNQGYRVIAIPRIGAASTLTVQYKGKNIYNKAVVDSTDRDNYTYISPGFTNKRNAPASLSLNVYRSGSQFIGQFSETSFLPVVPYLTLQCKNF